MAKFVIGLTGGIGSGKTAVSDYFAALDIDVIDADVIAHTLTQKNSPLLTQLQHHFGDWVIDDDGNYNRPAMRAFVFDRPHALEQLNQIVHPAIRDEIKRQLKHSTSAYTMLSVPLLFESFGKKNSLMALCQRFLVVDVDEQTQIQRASLRDDVSQAQIQTIIAKQISRAKRLALAQKLNADIVDNTGTLTHLYQQLAPLHQHYLTLAKS